MAVPVKEIISKSGYENNVLAVQLNIDARVFNPSILKFAIKKSEVQKESIPQ